MAEAAQPEPAEQVRAAEIAASLCLATDTGMGFAWEHGLAATLSAMRLCDLVAVDAPTRQQAYYVSLLTYVGCNADAAVKAGIFGGPIEQHIVRVIWGGPLDQMRLLLRMLPQPEAPRRTALTQVAAGLPRALRHLPREQLGLCEVAQLMSRRLSLPAEVDAAFYYLTERWDGSGLLRRGRAEELPLALRIALLARDAAYWTSIAGADVAARVMLQRGGKAHDPGLAKVLAGHRHEVLGDVTPEAGAASCWDAVLAAEPEPRIVLQGDRIDRALTAVGDFADLLTPSLSGHCHRVADLAAGAAGAAGLPAADIAHIGRAALVQDIGRATVPAPVWDRAGELTPDEWERVRLHPYYTQRICAPSPFLRSLGDDAACHHERLDGSGYYRGVGAESLSPAARILAAADAMGSLLQRRPYREAVPLPSATDRLVREVAAGRMDADAVAAVIEAAGGDPPALPRPAGLTEREAQVVALLARGLATKQVARTLGISAKTVDRHTEHAYRKIGVSSRAGVALFANEHGLLAWGEYPIGAGYLRA
jgi:HD-GYP domain-containing protein (c-di-GMP phosphodiesterase class II)